MVLQDIFIYPIKSLGGIRLDQVVLEEKGAQWDRRWMLADKKGIFLSQRTNPKMALLQVNLQKDGLLVFHKEQPHLKIEIPFYSYNQVYKEVQIWEDLVIGQIVGKEFSEWFSDTLNISCDLIFMPKESERFLKPKYAVNKETVSFADGMPYLIIGQGSLDDLNNRLDLTIGMDRFRPNLVFSGGPAFIEDEWKKVQVGEALFKITKPCARCVMTTVDQNTAKKGKEPLKTLSTYRTVDHLVMFGQNMLLLEGNEIKVGDEVFGIPK